MKLDSLRMLTKEEEDAVIRLAEEVKQLRDFRKLSEEGKKRVDDYMRAIKKAELN